MSNKIFAAALALGVALGGTAFAKQNSSPVCNHTKSVMENGGANGANSTTSMANTSSDGAMTSTGASSAAIGTGNTDKTGVYSPCATAAAPRGSTGALPNSTPNTP